MVNCVIKCCRNYKVTQELKNTFASFHLFPRDPVLADRWVKIVQKSRDENCWTPHPLSTICSAHFHSKYKYITKNGLHRLKREAIPTKKIMFNVRNREDRIIMQGVPEVVRTASEEIDSQCGDSKSNSVKICRCCLADRDQLDFYEEIDTEKLKEHLNLFLPEDTRLPPLICLKCANFLIEVKKFRETVTASHTKLMQAIVNRTSMDCETAQETHKNTVEPITEETIQHIPVVVKTEKDIEVNQLREYTDPLATPEIAGVEENINEIEVKIEMEPSLEMDYEEHMDFTPLKYENTETVKDESSSTTDCHEEDNETEIDSAKASRKRGRPKGKETQEEWTHKDGHSSSSDYNVDDETEIESTKAPCKKTRSQGDKVSLSEEIFSKAQILEKAKLKLPEKESNGLHYLLNDNIKRQLTKNYRKNLKNSECDETELVTENQSEIERVATKRDRSIVWSLESTFDSGNDAEMAVQAEATWSFYYDHDTDFGKKCYYRCNKLKKRGPQCSAKIYLLFEKSSVLVHLFRAQAAHDHEQKIEYSSSYRLSDSGKAKRLCSINKAKVDLERTQAWRLAARFDRFCDAEDAVQAEDTWSLHYDHDTDEGKKNYYRCNKLKRRGPQCSAKLYLLYEKFSTEVYMFKSEAVHDHDQKLDSSSNGISNRAKAEINRMAELKMKPKAIIMNLMTIKDMEIPKMSQLRNYLNYRRQKLNEISPSTMER